jgi:2'-5' RNA ligase
VADPTSAEDQSALVVLVPEAERWVSGLRGRFDRSARLGMPAHITVLYPFRPPDRVSPDVLASLRALFARVPRFAFRLVGVCGFPGVIYLAPDPADPFDALTRTVAQQFPDTPPYAGMIDDPKPHLTVAQQPPATSLEDATAELIAGAGAALPLACTATEVALAVKRGGRWSVAGTRFALA